MTVHHQNSAVENAGPAQKDRPGSEPGLRPRCKSRSAFSIIEICIALGIVAFAFVALIGLLPVGLGNFGVAMNTQTCAQIYQKIAGELQESDFDTLLANKVQTGGQPEPMFFRYELRYFDTEGTEVKSDSPNIIYTVRTRGSLPGKADPTKHRGTWFTSLPDINGQRFNPRDLMIFTIQVVQTKGRDLSVVPVDSTTFLILPDAATKAGMPIRTYSIAVARNGFNTLTP